MASPSGLFKYRRGTGSPDKAGIQWSSINFKLQQEERIKRTLGATPVSAATFRIWCKQHGRMDPSCLVLAVCPITSPDRWALMTWVFFWPRAALYVHVFWCYCVSNNKIAEECFQERFVFVPRRIKTDKKGPNSNKVSCEHSCLSFLGQLFGHFKLSVLLWTNFFIFAKLLIYSSLFIINHWFNFSSVAACYNIRFLEWASGEWS